MDLLEFETITMNLSYTSNESNVMRYAIWYHLYNFKNVKHTHGGVLILIKLQAFSLQLY